MYLKKNLKYIKCIFLPMTLMAFNTAAQIPLPEGDNGIASKYPGDVGIQNDQSVIFADDFEAYNNASGLTINWSHFYHAANTRIDTEHFYTGSRSLEFTLPLARHEVSNAVIKNLSIPQDSLFVRVYTKFESGYDVTIQGHNGIRISSSYPGPGNKPDGSDFFLFMLENSRYFGENNPGYLNVYAYHPEQRSGWGDHWYPDGRVLPGDHLPGDFGNDFISRPGFIPQTNRWYCYEFMVRANSPGKRDGRVAVWIDGILVADFQNVRMRDSDSMKIDQVQLELHAGSNLSGAVRKWYDNLVIAVSYIGPVKSEPVER
jgi:hypothetical protein